MSSPDVIIAGAGIIGVSIALELRRRGASVVVLDRGEPGREASSAAAGMLAALDPETPSALRGLARESARLFPDYVREIERFSGMGVDFRNQGTIALRETASAPPGYRALSGQELRHVEPALETRGCYAFFVDEACVDPALLMQGALRAAAASGVDVRARTEVTEIRSHSGEVSVLAGSQRILGKAAVNCRGAWSGAPIKPRKGQMISVRPDRDRLLDHVVVTPEVYVAPRSSGKMVIGATVEDVGFDKTVEAKTVLALHHSISRFVPELGKARVVESWAGLRPGSPDDLPMLGGTEAPGIFAATGHFRNGILLAPVTAHIIANLVTGSPAAIDISAFSPLRFALAGPR